MYKDTKRILVLAKDHRQSTGIDGTILGHSVHCCTVVIILTSAACWAHVLRGACNLLTSWREIQVLQIQTKYIDACPRVLS